jgi:PAS domain S-box-containing protein
VSQEVDSATIIVNTLLILAILILFIYFLSSFRKLLHTKKHLEQKDSSEVGFVVDTFHDLVSKLKDKEQELEGLRQNAEDRAIAIEDYNENILQSVPSGVISFDEGMHITKANSAAEKILEIHAHESIGRHQAEVLRKPITHLLSKKNDIERGEYTYITPSGKRIWLGLTLSDLKNTDGKSIGKILVFTDLTNLKAFESQVALRDKFSSLGEISAGIAHELRNPMGVIAGYTKLLSKKVDSSVKPTVDVIEKEIAAMDRIISDFLSFAKLTELNLSDISLQELIENCLKTVLGNRTDIRTRLRIRDIPSIRADEVMLRQAFTNLIQNAVESMPGGGELSIDVSAHGLLDMTVSDTGHGISENIRDKIFSPFFTTKEKGTGLGLAIVHKIIASHGGHIRVESSEKGTTFRIRIPLQA